MQHACVVGLGKIGYPLAAQFASKGWKVVGADIRSDVVDQFRKGEVPAWLSEPGVDAAIATAAKEGRLSATTSTAEAVAQCEVVVVIVPVLVAEKPPHKIDLSMMLEATRNVARGLKQGTLVIFESTLPVGTTRNVLTPLLESESKLRHGVNFHVAFSPERVYSGRIIKDLAAYPKIVGGIDMHAEERAKKFYCSVLDAPVNAVGSAEAAELVKLAETTYRDVNIAFANQLAMLADQHGLSVAPIISAANSQPFCHIHQPGVGVGGHCIPVYPYFYMDGIAKEDLKVLTQEARRINDSMAKYAVSRLGNFLGGLQAKRILILGYAYRGDVKEKSFSSAFKIHDALKESGALPMVHDTMFSASEMRDGGLSPISDFAEASEVVAVILQAGHKEYRSIPWHLLPKCEAVFDGRRFFARDDVPQRIALLGIGAPMNV